MKYGRFIGIVIASIAIFMLISPVAAWTPGIRKTCDPQECIGSTITCHIYVTFASHSKAYLGKFSDTLPAGSSGATATAGGTCAGTTCTWPQVNVPSGGIAETEYQVTFTPPSPPPSGTIYKNRADVWVADKPAIGALPSWGYQQHAHANLVYSTDHCESVPEFPTIALPIGMIIGFLGVVFFVRSTKE